MQVPEYGMIERIFMMAPRIDAPDYGTLIRQGMGALRSGTGSFARTLEQQREAERQGSVPAAETKGAPAGRPAADEKLSPAAGVLPEGGGIALDPRSLATLRRLAHDGRAVPPERENAPSPVKKTAPPPTVSEPEPGKLSAQYESGSRGIGAIGYDRVGGTSYGKYQISSRQGSFSRFLSFLAGKAPELAERLRNAGAADTGGRRGAVPEEWQAIAAEQPERFEKLQEGFIRNDYYEPALAGVSEKLGLRELSHPLREVLWSTAVQHGPAGALLLFEQAVRRLAGQGKNPDNERALIETVYSLRKTRFTSSSPEVQAAVSRRFDQESRQALAMLEESRIMA
jgi:hypothetical protein